MQNGHLNQRLSEIQRNNQAHLATARMRAAQRGLAPHTPTTAPRTSNGPMASLDRRADGSMWQGLPTYSRPPRLPPQYDPRGIDDLGRMSQQIAQDLYASRLPYHPDARYHSPSKFLYS